jgi:uncharacterized membrane protein
VSWHECAKEIFGKGKVEVLSRSLLAIFINFATTTSSFLHVQILVLELTDVKKLVFAPFSDLENFISTARIRFDSHKSPQVMSYGGGYGGGRDGGYNGGGYSNG